MKEKRVDNETQRNKRKNKQCEQNTHTTGIFYFKSLHQTVWTYKKIRQSRKRAARIQSAVF